MKALTGWTLVIPFKRNSMQLILDDYGLSVEKKENMFSIKLGITERTVSPVKIKAIHIYKNAMVSTAALLMAAENDIPVLIYDSYYKPCIRVWNSNFTSTGEVRVLQPMFCQSKGGMWWAKHLIALKTEGQVHNLTAFKDKFRSAAVKVVGIIPQIQNMLLQINGLPEDVSKLDTLMGYEGISSSWYWQGLNAVLDDAVFIRRIQRNPTDPFNACLNYLYGILYGKVEGSLLAYGLDPFVGLMHAEGYSKKSLVYDCIEPFRPWAEMLLVEAFRNKTLLSTHFEYDNDKLSIAKEGRKVLVSSFISFLNQKTMMNGRRTTRNDQVTALCSQLSQAVKNLNPRPLKGGA